MFLAWFVSGARCSPSREIDIATVAAWVMDGDTFDTTQDTELDWPMLTLQNMEKAGTTKAKNFMISLVYGRTVYLDIDDLYRTDNCGRLISVVYIEHGSTH